MNCFTLCMKTLLLFSFLLRFWVGYQYVITNQNHSVEGRWEVAYKGIKDLFALFKKWKLLICNLSVAMLQIFVLLFFPEQGRCRCFSHLRV